MIVWMAVPILEAQGRVAHQYPAAAAGHGVELVFATKICNCTTFFFVPHRI